MKTKRHLVQLWLLVAACLPALTARAQPAVMKVVAGENDTLFLKSDGSLWGMGANAYGELGDGTTNEQDYPEQLVPSGVTAMAVGEYHCLFLKSDGSLWAMGYNGYGQLGDGTYGAGHSKSVPEQIMASNVLAIAAGYNHSLSVKSDGGLWGMGDNEYAQLYAEPSGVSVSPTEIVTSEVTAVAAGGNHELFIKRHSSGVNLTTELWGMGDNFYGQLGDGSTNTPVSPNSPVKILSTTVATGAAVTTIATGVNHSLFIKSDGSLWGMGFTAEGELGINTNLGLFLTPLEIVTSNVVAVAAGDYHSVFTKNDGSLWLTGQNYFGQLGDDDIYYDPITLVPNGIYSAVPEQIITGGVTAIAAGGDDSLFVETGGSLWGMGVDEDTSYSFSGQLGDGGGGSFRPEEIVWGPPPALGITAYNNQPVVIFPTTPGTNFVLQMTTNLSSGVWTAAPGGVSFTGVQFTNAPANAFFRLQPP